MMTNDQLAGLTLRDGVHHEVLAASEDPQADDLEPAYDVEPGEDVLPAPYDGKREGQWRIGYAFFSEREAGEVIDAEYIYKETVEFVEEAGREIPTTEKILNKIIIEVNGEPYTVTQARIGRCSNCGQLVQQTGVCYRCTDVSERDVSR